MKYIQAHERRRLITNSGLAPGARVQFGAQIEFVGDGPAHAFDPVGGVTPCGLTRDDLAHIDPDGMPYTGGPEDRRCAVCWDTAGIPDDPPRS